MRGAPTKAPGDCSAAESPEREHDKERSRNSDRTSKRRIRRSSSSRAAAAATTVEPGERNKEEEEGREKAFARDKTKGQGRSMPLASGSAPLHDVDKEGGKRSKGRQRRTSDSHSSGPSRRSSVRKPRKDNATGSSRVLEAHLMVDRASAASTGRASPSSSEQGPTQRKRRRSSNSEATDEEDHHGKQEEDEMSGSGDDEEQSNLVEDSLVPNPAFPAELAANNSVRRQTPLEDKQPLTPVSELGAEKHKQRIEATACDTRSRNSELGKERSCRGGGGEERGKSSQRRARFGRKKSTRRREEAALEEKVHETGTDDGYGTEEGAPGACRTRSTAEVQPRRKRTAEHESLSTGLGVKVIDGGTTKQLVITVGDAVAERNKSGGSSDQSRGTNASSKPLSDNRRRGSPAQHGDGPLQNRERNHRRRRRQFPLDPEEEERSRVFRDNVATAVLTKGEETVKQLRTERSEDLADEAAPPAEYKQSPPAGSSEVTKDHPGQADHRHLEHPLAFSGIDKAPTCTVSPSESPRMAPSFSIAQETATASNISNHQPLSHGPPSSANKLPNTSMSVGNQGGAPPSPAPSTSSSSSSSSSVLSRAVQDRTAKYVMRQASFHDNIPGNYIGLNSPLGGGEGEKNDVGTAVPFPSAKKINVDPVLLSTRLETDMVRGTRRNDNDHREGVISSGPAERARASSNLDAGGRTDLLASSPTRSTNVQACRVRQQGESVRVDPSQQQGLRKRRTRPLSQARFPSSSFEQDDEVARDLVHFRIDLSRRLAFGDRPELFFLRPNESLAIARIEGSGRLLVTVREEGGAAALVAVDGAIVYDSAAHFGHAAVQTDHRFPYVAGHRYEFQVVPSQGVELAIRGSGDGQRTASSRGSQVETLATGLQVVFSVTSSYAKGARLRREDAVGLSLPTFEAPGYNSQQPKQSPPATTKKTPPTPSVSRDATEGDPHSADVQRPPSVGIATAITAPCLSPPQVAPRVTVGITAPTPAAPAPPAVPKALAETSSNVATARIESGRYEGFEQKGHDENSSFGDRENDAERGGLHRSGSTIERERRDSRDHNTGSHERYLRPSPIPTKSGGRSPCSRRVLDENLAVYPYHTPQHWETGAEGPVAMKRKSPAWEQQHSTRTPVEALPTLPYIRQHVDYASPPSAFEQHNLSTGMGSYAPRDVSGAGHFVRSPSYYSQRKGHTASDDGNESHTRYHPPPPREQKHHAPPRYHHPGYFSDGQRSSTLPGRQHLDGHSSKPIASEHQISPYNWSTGGSHRWGEPRDNREHKNRSSKSNPRNRWKEDRGEGWTGRSERDVRLAAGHAYRPVIGRGINSEAESIRQHRPDGGDRKDDYTSLPDRRRGGFKYGGGLPPSGKEPGEMAAALSDQSGGRAVAREEVAMDRGGREESSEVQQAAQGSDQVRKRGGYPERLATDGQDRRRRIPQNAHNDHRKPRHGTGVVHQTSTTTRATEERVPARWIKF